MAATLKKTKHCCLPFINIITRFKCHGHSTSISEDFEGVCDSAPPPDPEESVHIELMYKLEVLFFIHKKNTTGT